LSGPARVPARGKAKGVRVISFQPPEGANFDLAALKARR
jgi:hypothetical protein